MSSVRWLFRLAAALAVASPVSAQWKPVADAGMVPTLELDLARGAPAVEAVPPAFVAPPLPGVQRTSRDAALMIVGGAAFLLGAVIGDDAGGVLMVGGAVVGLVGLYQYLR